MSFAQTHNKLIACEPWPGTKAIQPKVEKGFAMADKKVTLQALKVVMSSTTGFYAGMTIHVRADRVIQPWAKEVHEFGDLKFILVPESEVQFAVENRPSGQWESGC